jgi:hypothetical protein
MDSLGAVELRTGIAALVGQDVPATLAFDYPTAMALAGFVQARREALSKPRAAGKPPAGALEADDEEVVLTSLSGLVWEVIGHDVDDDQPLMEVTPYLSCMEVTPYLSCMEVTPYLSLYGGNTISLFV